MPPGECGNGYSAAPGKPVAPRPPADLIGRHAARHIEQELTYAPLLSWPEYQAGRSARNAAESRALREDLRRVTSQGNHGELTRELRRGRDSELAAGQDPGELRLLLGAHGIDAFAAATARHDWLRDTVRRLARS